MRKRSEPVRRPWKLTTKLMLTSIYQGMKRIIFISVFKKPKIFQGRRGEAQDDFQHQETADGRQQERVRKPTTEN